jgi:hypothetical protein
MPESNVEANTGLKLTALSVADAAKVLSRMCGKTIADAAIRAHVNAGAPTNADGTINLVAYAAWLAKENANAN